MSTPRTMTPVSTNAVPWNPDQALPSSINPGLGSQLHALFDAPDPRVVTGGVLHWFGDSEFPDGTTNVPTLSQQEWQTYYTRLETAALAHGLLPALTSLSERSNDFRPDGPVPLAIANVALSVVTPDFSQRVLAAAIAGTALDPAPDGLASVIQPERAFLATAFLHGQFGKDVPVVRTRAVTFVLDEHFYCANPGTPLPDVIEVDPGDGRPARRVTFGDTVTALYPTADQATVTVRCHFGDTVLEARTTVGISDERTAPIPDDQWSLLGLPSGSTGTAFVWRAPGHADVVNPVVVCEGFPGGYPYDYVYDCLSRCGTLEAMFARGYDLVVVRFDDGSGQMQHSADVAVAAIRQALARASKRNGAKLPLVVGGVSMGGLIARYALALMESRGAPHGARLFFSIDSPHTGAYTSVADQWLLHYLAPASSLSKALAALVDSPANQQFMQYWVRGGDVIVSPLRTQFLRDLEGIGSWPQIPHRIAISDGCGDGTRSIPAHAQLLEWSGGPFASARLFALPEGAEPAVIGEAYCFRADGSTPPQLRAATRVSWEGAPGGLNVYNAMTAGVAQGIGIGALSDEIPITLCIPTLSALGMDVDSGDPFAPIPAPGTGASPFHDYLCCSTNSRHITLWPEASAFLLRHLGTPVVEPVPSPSAGSARFDPSAFNPHDPNFSKNPYPTYRNFRQHAPVHWVEPYESFWVFRRDDVLRVLDDSENFSAITYAKNRDDPPPTPPHAPFDVLANMPEGLFSLDPPRHGEVRAPMDDYLARLLGQVPSVASVIARQLLVTAKQSGRIELFTAYALPLPASTLLSLMGVPQQDWKGVMSWVGGVAAGHDITQPASVQGLAGTCAMALGSYFQALMRGTTTSGCPFHAGKGKLLDLMITEGMGAAPKMSPEEVQATSVNLAIAGYLSTTFLIVTGLLDLLGGVPLPGDPERKAPAELPIDMLRKNPQLMESAVNEMLRYDSPFQLTDRYVVNRNTTLGGVRLRIGDPVTLVFGSANRDETAYVDPDTFDITRQGPPHLGYGGGIHRCYGAPLVEQVAPVAFRMLLQELRTIQLAGTPQWQTDPYIRSVSNLPLKIE